MVLCSWRRALIAGLAIGALLAPMDAGKTQARHAPAASGTLVIGYQLVSPPISIHSPSLTKPHGRYWK